MEEIVGATLISATITDVVVRESLFIRKIVDGEIERERINLDPLLSSGLLTVVQADNDNELNAFIDLAIELGDGEAMSAALAMSREWILVTDDRKAERLLHGQVQLRPTLAIVKEWAETNRISTSELRIALTGIHQRGYRPAVHHPLGEWWESIMSDA
jgi:predicted nucleic acid-binding protein